MSTFTLEGGRVVDPASGRDLITNLQVSGGRVVNVGPGSSGESIDVDGCVVTPGFVDLHVHLRQPGGEESETIATGTAAAAAGGFTAVCTMPNTDPVTDTPEGVAYVRSLADRSGYCDVFPVGAITEGQRGQALVDVRGLADAGVRYLSDDGHPVVSAAIMREALEMADKYGMIVGNHAQEPTLTVDAQVNEGDAADALGLPGWPNTAEEVMIARDLLLAGDLGARLHVPHVSTATSVDLVRWAKARGIRVTAEATPHHLTLTDQNVLTHDTRFKVNPPLRSRTDVEAVRRGLQDGTVDTIATDHAPHADRLKMRPWRHAPFGMTGSETALAVTITHMVKPGYMSLPSAVAALSYKPKRVLDLPGHGGPIRSGEPANLTVFDPSQVWTVDPTTLNSKSTNSPFAGCRLQGKVIHTILRGKFTVRDGKLAEQAFQ